MQSCHLSCWWPFHMHSNLKKKKGPMPVLKRLTEVLLSNRYNENKIFAHNGWIYKFMHNIHSDLLSVHVFTSEKRDWISIVIISIEKRLSIAHHTIATLLEEIQFKTSKCILFWDSQVRSTINSWNTREHYQNINNISTWMLQEASWYLFPLPWSRIASKQMPLSSLTLRAAFFHFSSKCELLSTKPNEL